MGEPLGPWLCPVWELPAREGPTWLVRRNKPGKPGWGRGGLKVHWGGRHGVGGSNRLGGVEC